MFCSLFTTVLPAAFLIISVAQPFELPGKADRPLANSKLQRDIDVRTSKDRNHNKDHDVNLLTGILRSNRFSQYANEIPCDILSTLENNGDEAAEFVARINDGDGFPKIIENLPGREKIQQAFSSIISIVYAQPSKTREAIEASVTGAVDWFNENGSRFSPRDFNAITTQGSDTAAHSTTCSEEGCVGSASATQSCHLSMTKNAVSARTITTTVSSEKSTRTTPTQKPIHKVTTHIMPANSSLPITVISDISRTTSPVPSIIPEAQTTSLGTRIASRPSKSMSIGLYAVAILCVFGVAVLL